MNQQKHIKLGQLLVHHGMVKEWQFLAAMGARRPGQKLGEVMIERAFLSEEQLMEALSLQLDLPLVKLGGIIVDPASIKAMPGHVARRFVVFPIALRPAVEKGDVPTLVVAMQDPTDERVIDALRFLLDCDVEPVLASRKDLLRAIEKTYGPDDPGSADVMPIPVPRSKVGRYPGAIAMSLIYAA